MKFKNLEEAVTSQGFKFGFELECIMPTDIEWENINLAVQFNGTSDSSIKLNPDMDKTEWEPLELVSEPMMLNPQSIVNVKKSIIELHKHKVVTNETCGFHVHYSYSTMTFADICWLLTNLSVNADAQKLFSEFEDIQFFSEEYADIEFLYNIKDQLLLGTPPNKIFSTDKYRIIRIHPQGTMEWRGPRDFMNNGDLSLIDKFFIRLYKNADVINKLIANKEVTITESHSDILKGIVDMNNGPMVIKKNEFYKDLNSNDSKIKTNIKANNPNRKDTRFSPLQDPLSLNDIFKLKPELNKCKMSNIAAKINGDRLMIAKGKFSGTISGVDFDQTVIEYSDLTDCTATGRSISNTTINKSKLILINTLNCEMNKCKMNNVSASSSEINGCDIYQGSYMRCEIKDSRLMDDVYTDDFTKTINCKFGE